MGWSKKLSSSLLLIVVVVVVLFPLEVSFPDGIVEAGGADRKEENTSSPEPFTLV